MEPWFEGDYLHLAGGNGHANVVHHHCDGALGGRVQRDGYRDGGVMDGDRGKVEQNLRMSA